MDKKLLIDSYLEGKHPIGQEKWELPSESELDRDEALYDALLAQNKKASLLGGRFGRGPARPYSSGNFTIAVTAKVTKQKAMMLRKNC